MFMHIVSITGFLVKFKSCCI